MIGRPVVHLATRAVVGWTLGRSAVSDLGRLEALLGAMSGPESATQGRAPLVVVPWCPTIARVLHGPGSSAGRLRDVVIQLPSHADPHDFEVALARVHEQQLRASITFEGDVAALVQVHERGVLDVVRISSVRGALDSGPAALETRLGMRLLETLGEAGVTVVVGGVSNQDIADRLRRAGLRFGQGALFESDELPTVRSEPWRSPTVGSTPFEGERLEMIARSHVLDSPPEQAFDTVVDLVAERCRTPMSAVSIVAHDRQWFKASRGLDVGETPRAHAFCAVAITQERPLVVPDALSDLRFSTNPLVLGSPYIRSYLGVPLRASSGLAFGALCVMDRASRAFTEGEVREVAALAQLVTDSLELRAR